jgi:hypothetical protein
MASVVLLALAAAFYPTLLAIVLVVLGRPRPARLLVAYLIGGLIVSIAAGCVVVFALKGAGVGSGSKKTLSPAVDIAAGAVSLLLALLLVSGRDPRPDRLKKSRDAEPGHDSWTRRAVGRDSLKMAFVLGLVLDLPSVWYLVALKDIAVDHHSAAVRLGAILVFNVIMFALVEIPLIAYLLYPERARAAVGRLNAWLHGHVRQIAEALAGGIGAYLVVKGVAAL